MVNLSFPIFRNGFSKGSIFSYTKLQTSEGEFASGKALAYSNGVIYGTTSNAGVHNEGVIYKYIIFADTASTASNVTCNGGSTGSATTTLYYGTSPYTYSWSDAGSQTTVTANGLSAGTYTVTVTDYSGCSVTSSTTITQPAALGVSAVVTSVSCTGSTGGSISATASGGIIPYTYLWSGGSTNSTIGSLTAGTYTITVTDNNGCTTSSSAIIASISVSISKTNVNCNGGNDGSLTANPAGGTPPFTFSWNPGGLTTSSITGLTIGTYTVTVTDNNGCTASSHTTITQPTALVLTPVIQQEVQCYGGSDGEAKVGVVGGVSPYTYSWSPPGSSLYIIGGLTVGTYTVTVTDKHGCTATTTATLTQPTPLTDSLVYINYPTCKGGTGSAEVGVAGGTSPYMYTWSPPVTTTNTGTGLTSRTYVVSIKDADGCTSALTFSITQPSTNLGFSYSCSSNTVTLTPSGGTPPYTYLWAPGGATTPTLVVTCSTIYTVTITDHAGVCSQGTVAETSCCEDGPVKPNLQSVMEDPLSNITLYPNPTTGDFNISGLEIGEKLELYNTLGQLVENYTATNITMTFSTAKIPDGMYLMLIISKDGVVIKHLKLAKTE